MTILTKAHQFLQMKTKDETIQELNEIRDEINSLKEDKKSSEITIEDSKKAFAQSIQSGIGLKMKEHVSNPDYGKPVVVKENKIKAFFNKLIKII